MGKYHTLSPKDSTNVYFPKHIPQLIVTNCQVKHADDHPITQLLPLLKVLTRQYNTNIVLALVLYCAVLEF